MDRGEQERQERIAEITKTFHEEVGFENVLLKYRIRAVLPFVVGPWVLDVGCGMGYLCRAMADRVEHVTGLDGSSVQLARARSINVAPNITYEHALFESWTSPHVYQTITATGVLEHVPDAQEFLRHCHAMLSPQGRIVVTVPNALALHKRLGKAMGIIEDPYALTPEDPGKGHLRVYDRRRLEEEMTGAGLSLLHSGGYLLKPLSNTQMESWDPRIVEALYDVGKELPDYCSSLIVVGTRAL